MTQHPTQAFPFNRDPLNEHVVQISPRALVNGFLSPLGQHNMRSIKTADGEPHSR